LAEVETETEQHFPVEQMRKRKLKRFRLIWNFRLWLFWWPI
jgi:hypothetical protein